MKLSSFVFAAATLTTANALNLRGDNDDKRSLQDLEGVLDVTTHGEAHGELEVYCKEQVSVMRSIVDNLTEGIVSMAMERVSNTKVADAIVTEDTCMVMGCTGERRLFSLALIETISMTIQEIVDMIVPWALSIINGSSVESFGGASLTDIVNAFSARFAAKIDTAETEVVTEVAAETEKVAASEVIIGEALAIEDGNARKLQIMGLLDSLFTLINGLMTEPENAVQLILDFVPDSALQQIFTFLLGLVLGPVFGLVGGVNYAPSAFAAVNDDASQMVKDLLEDVNVNDLLEIISGSIEKAKAMEITPFSMETAAQIEPCVNTLVAGAEEEANSIISIAVGGFCTSFCEN